MTPTAAQINSLRQGLMENMARQQHLVEDDWLGATMTVRTGGNAGVRGTVVKLEVAEPRATRRSLQGGWHVWLKAPNGTVRGPFRVEKL